jgi:hypothetical protein
MMSRVLMVDKDQRTATGHASTPTPYAVGTLIMVVGCALAFAGWLDVSLLWVPLRFSDVDWEFGTVSAMFDSLPLGTLGLTAILYGMLQRTANWPILLLAGIFWLLALLFLAATAIYGLAMPAIVRGTPANLADVLKMAVGKTLLLEFVYIVLYGWLGWFSLRCARARRSRS